MKLIKQIGQFLKSEVFSKIIRNFVEKEKSMTLYREKAGQTN